MLTVAPNMFPGFEGLYYVLEEEDIEYYYIINDIVYKAGSLEQSHEFSRERLLNRGQLFPSFNINTNGSQILAADINLNIMMYQQQPDGQFIKLLENPESYDEVVASYYASRILKVPLPNGQEVPLEGFYNTVYQELPLNSLSFQIDDIIRDNHNNPDQVLENLNSARIPVISTSISQSNPPQIENIPSTQESYETLKSIYRTLPDHLVINGLRVNFISFQQISDMLSQNQIERYVIDPLLQPYTTLPYSILTFFTKNGITYLAKVKYDQVNNRILP